jgi:pyruvate dehydrogenase E1 component alpha subunit
MLGVNPILGMGTPHAVGAAISARVRKTGQIVATFFGDGAASIGAVHESMNMASIWKLPVIFVCENNGYAQSTPVEYAVSVKDIAVRGASYNMPGVVVDGQDVFAVWEATAEAVRRARAGEGPSLIECKTYRYFGHHAGDNPRSYRFEDEETLARSRDCLERFRARVTENNLLTVADLDAADALNQTRMDEAVAFAEASPLPDPAELTTDVYSTERAEVQTERVLSTSRT